MLTLESIFFLSLVLLVVGTLLLLRGWWLAPRTAEALCRRCGYDVRMRDRTKPICVECGADLTQRRSIRFGRRRVNNLLVYLAAACFLFGLPPIIAALASRVSNVPLRQRVPVFSLIADIGNGNPLTAVATWEELQRRFDGGQLSVEQMNQIFRESMDLDLSRAASVREASTRLLSDIWKTGKLSDVVLKDFVARDLRAQLTTQSHIHAEDPIPFVISFVVPRFINDSMLEVSEHSVLATISQPTRSVDYSVDASDNRLTTVSRTEGGRERRVKHMLFAPAMQAMGFEQGEVNLRTRLTIDFAVPGGRRISAPVECETTFRVITDRPMAQAAPAQPIPRERRAGNASVLEVRRDPPRLLLSMAIPPPKGAITDQPVIIYLADGVEQHELARTIAPRNATTSVWVTNLSQQHMTALLRDDPKLIVRRDELAAARMLGFAPLDPGEQWFQLRFPPGKRTQLRELALEIERADGPE